MHKPKLRSFARRIGKCLSNIQKDLIKDVLPKHLVTQETPLINAATYEEVNIEVGIGMAEHFINQCALNPRSLFIGIEPYLNGIANCLKLAQQNNTSSQCQMNTRRTSVELVKPILNRCVPPKLYSGGAKFDNVSVGNGNWYNISNFELWPDDADLILENIPHNSISNFYLLFPDPWPKLKQKKRRFASLERLDLIKSSLKDDGFFVFVSDIADYAMEVEKYCAEIGLKKISTNYDVPHDGYIVTKFHSKALEAGRKPHFMRFGKL